MPGYDRTGPQGQGPMTGGGFGLCGGGRSTGRRFTGLGIGRGSRPGGGGGGRAFGGGRRQQGVFRHGYAGNYPVFDTVKPAGSESEFLKTQADDLRARLSEIEARLADMEKK
ncbi:MAG: DUF5320 domain-containing protein [Deltaproteobacteria bacterium]|nr:DUF5320 domain-containing protein [Deltaproteobacteria bacterium]MBW2051307.1 DUF5320 domain-containing protein [Deltaproteobacteria bacterium]MBW2140371.1 DUF5320 domain-containing protein [Deltaproteobacteria bacterium]MBW2323224.1 DUF5320 domain-containing protein [Deltaproteobacteria bacterium]